MPNFQNMNTHRHTNNLVMNDLLASIANTLMDMNMCVCVCVCVRVCFDVSLCCNSIISLQCRIVTISLMDSVNIISRPPAVHYVTSGSTETGHANWPLVYQAHWNCCRGSYIMTSIHVWWHIVSKWLLIKQGNTNQFIFLVLIADA